jgi:hypothetical protein
VDKLIADQFHTHRRAKIITSLIGIGDLLGVGFLAATGAAWTASPRPTTSPATPDWHPPRDSGRRVGTSTAPSGTTASSDGSSTPQP